MKKLSTRLMVLFIALCALSHMSASAQSPTFSLMGKNICSGDTVEVDVQVQDFTEIVGFQFTIGWDSTKIDLVEISYVNEILADNFFFGDINDTTDILTASWADGLVQGVTLEADEKVFTLKFATVEGENQLLSMLTFEDEPTVREVIIDDGNLQTIDGIWNDAMVMIDEPQFVDAAISEDVDMAGNGAIDLTITDGEAPFTFAWESGQTTEDISGLTTGDYSGTVTDAKGCTLSYGPFTVGNIVAVDEISGLEAVRLTPNPASEYVNLQVKLTEVTPLDISIYNLLGEQVRFDQIESANFVLEFDLADLANGTYFIQLQSKDGIHTEKLLLQR